MLCIAPVTDGTKQPMKNQKAKHLNITYTYNNNSFSCLCVHYTYIIICIIHTRISYNNNKYNAQTHTIDIVGKWE